MFKRLLTALSIVWLSISAVAPVIVFGQSTGVPVTVGVPPTRLVVSGCASPDAFVQFFDDNNPVGTVVAGSDGRFSKTINYNPSQAGLRNIRIFYDDVNSRTSSIVTNNISLAPQTTTALNLLLPTTIEHEPEPVGVGNFLIFRGTTCPQALVNVRIDNNLTLAAKADERGNWFVIADTEDYYVGAHVYEALSSLGSEVSQFTNKYLFNVTGEGGTNVPSGELSAPTIIEPVDMFISSTPVVTIRGTGPANAQLEVLIDGQPVGSIFINADGQWSFPINMSKDIHSITARVCDGGRCGESSNAVRIRYNGDLTACPVRFTLENYRFYGVPPDGGIDLKIQATGLSERAELLIDWGDTTVERLSLEQERLSLHHVYKQIGQYGGNVNVKYSNCSSSLYFSVVVTESPPLLWWVIPATGSGVTIWLGLRWRKNRHTHRAAGPRPEFKPKLKRWYRE